MIVESSIHVPARPQVMPGPAPFGRVAMEEVKIRYSLTRIRFRKAGHSTVHFPSLFRGFLPTLV